MTKGIRRKQRTIPMPARLRVSGMATKQPSTSARGTAMMYAKMSLDGFGISFVRAYKVAKRDATNFLSSGGHGLCQGGRQGRPARGDGLAADAAIEANAQPEGAEEHRQLRGQSAKDKEKEQHLRHEIEEEKVVDAAQPRVSVK